MVIRFASLLLLALAACSIGPSLEPPPQCGLPDGGRGCNCPGTSAQAFGCSEVFTCQKDGTWAPYDGSCLFRGDASDDAASGQGNPD